jgi:hypothetical protein
LSGETVDTQFPPAVATTEALGMNLSVCIFKEIKYTREGPEINGNLKILLQESQLNNALSKNASPHSEN